MSDEMGFQVWLDKSHSEAIEATTEALKQEGFGVLTTISIDQAFKEKIGADFRPYTILGACNPRLAHAALSSHPEIGLMLPCNVIVEDAEDSKGCIVRFMNPDMMMNIGPLGNDETIRQVAADATEKLQACADQLANGE